MTGILHISIQSFSYRNGYPEDTLKNGRGYVFDCRGILNPYHFGNLRFLTGKDEEIENFFLLKTKMPKFLDLVKDIISISIDEYLNRSYPFLQINFGCTGGQHRSVFCAEQITKFCKEKYPQTKVTLLHTNQNNWQIIN